MASVDSMNGAPRIAPTPTPWDAAEPPPDRIAMIGIIVSGRAVPTAARTDPTAPSASSSFRPNHSIPYVNSSAPRRMTKNAPIRIRISTSAPQPHGERHGRRDDKQDQGGDDRHPWLASSQVADERRDDAGGRRGDDHDQAQPQEPLGLQADEVRDEPTEIECRTGGRSATRRQPETQPDDQERDREVRPDGQEPGDRVLEAR